MPTLQEIAASASRPRRSTLGTVMEGARGGELRAYEPGVMDNVRNFAMNALAPLFGGDVRAANAYYRDKIQPTAEFLPGIGDVMAAGEAKDAFGQGDYLGGGLLAAGAAAGLVPGVGDVAQKGASKAAKGIRAYHGSPHDFDKFSLDKIGTGEGAQAYGHGLYFAENEGIARSYRDKLQKSGNPLLDDSGKLSQILMKNFPKHGGGAVVNGIVYPNAKHVVEGISQGLIKRGDIPDEVFDVAYEFTIPGRMYEVNINANPEDFLDWDKPLSEQPEGVRKALQALDIDVQGMSLKDRIETIEAVRNNPDQAYILDRKQSGVNIGADEVARQLGTNVDQLRQAGIPGIKYLDAGSRGAGDGSRNYVVFDDSLIEILRKYGVLPAAVGTGAFMQMMENDPEQAQQLHDYAVSIRDGA
jgi:hypothetical protein